jgi:hypothetical protein
MRSLFATQDRETQSFNRTGDTYASGSESEAGVDLMSRDSSSLQRNIAGDSVPYQSDE